MDLSRQFPQEQAENTEDLSLVQMGGSKKRKRSPSRSTEVENNESEEVPVTDFHTTVPTVKMGIRARRRQVREEKMRKYEEAAARGARRGRGRGRGGNWQSQNNFNPNQGNLHVNPQESAANYKNQPVRGRGRGRNAINHQNAENSNVNQQPMRPGNISKNSPKRVKTEQGSPQKKFKADGIKYEHPSPNNNRWSANASGSNQNFNQQNNRHNPAMQFQETGINFEPPVNNRWNDNASTSNQNQNYPRNNRQNNRNQRNNQNSPAFEPYDYASVDFRQFQGGANHVRQTKEYRGNFRGRVMNLFDNNNKKCLHILYFSFRVAINRTLRTSTSPRRSAKVGVIIPNFFLISNL